MHTFRRRSSAHGTLVSSCFRRLHYMSAGSPKLFQEIKSFEEALAHQLQALIPKEGDCKKVLQLSWLTTALALALEKHLEAVSLIPPLNLPLLVCDEKWMNDYMDQTTRILDTCNALTGVFCNIEQSHLLLRHACHILLDIEKAPLHGEADANIAVLHQEQLSCAHRSLQEWLDLQVSHKPQKFSPTLQEMIKGMVPPQEKDLAKGKGFLYALYGANATTVFVFYILSLAVSHEDEILSMILPIPSTFVWSASISHLLELAKDNAKQQSGSNVCLEDLGALEVCVKDLFHLIERSLALKEHFLSDQDAKKLAGAVNETSLLLDNIAKGLDLLRTKLNEMFKVIVSSRSSLLDKLGDFGSDDL